MNGQAGQLPGPTQVEDSAAQLPFPVMLPA